MAKEQQNIRYSATELNSCRGIKEKHVTEEGRALTEEDTDDMEQRASSKLEKTGEPKNHTDVGKLIGNFDQLDLQTRNDTNAQAQQYEDDNLDTSNNSIDNNSIDTDGLQSGSTDFIQRGPIRTTDSAAVRSTNLLNVMHPGRQSHPYNGGLNTGRQHQTCTQPSACLTFVPQSKISTPLPQYQSDNIAANIQHTSKLLTSDEVNFCEDFWRLEDVYKDVPQEHCNLTSPASNLPTTLQPFESDNPEDLPGKAKTMQVYTDVMTQEDSMANHRSRSPLNDILRPSETVDDLNLNPDEYQEQGNRESNISWPKEIEDLIDESMNRHTGDDPCPIVQNNFEQILSDLKKNLPYEKPIADYQQPQALGQNYPPSLLTNIPAAPTYATNAFPEQIARAPLPEVEQELNGEIQMVNNPAIFNPQSGLAAFMTQLPGSSKSQWDQLQYTNTNTSMAPLTCMQAQQKITAIPNSLLPNQTTDQLTMYGTMQQPSTLITENDLTNVATQVLPIPNIQHMQTNTSIPVQQPTPVNIITCLPQGISSVQASLFNTDICTQQPLTDSMPQNLQTIRPKQDSTYVGMTASASNQQDKLPEAKVSKRQASANKKVAKLTLEQLTCPINDKGDIGLHIAATIKDTYVLTAILDRLKAENRAILIDAKNNQGQTPLYLAVYKNITPNVTTLLKYNADPNVLSKYIHSDRTETQSKACIHIASSQGKVSLQVLKALLGHRGQTRINVNLPTSKGMTALHCAVSEHGASGTGDSGPISSKEIIQELISAGADPTIGDNSYGNTPLMYAIYQTSHELVRIILNCVDESQTLRIIEQEAKNGKSSLDMAEALRDSGNYKIWNLIYDCQEAMKQQLR